MSNSNYNSIGDFLKGKFNEKVFKVTLNSHLGCPNIDGTIGHGGCSFCSLDRLNPAASKSDKQKTISEQLNEGMTYVRRRHRANKFIAHFQNGTNTYGPIEKLKRDWGIAISHPNIVGIAISTRPDTLSTAIIDELAEISKRTLLWVELGLQSANDRTLERVNRGHTVRQFEDAVNLLHKKGIKACAHVILGLPDEDETDFSRTALLLNKCKIWGVKINNLHVLKGTKLETEYNEGKVKIPTLDEYALWAKDFIEHLDPQIIIHRFNSHSPRDLTIAPLWSVNKLATYNAIIKRLKTQD